MADSFEQKQRAANLRLLSAMTGNQRPQSQSAPSAPNYSAIPLDPPQPARYPGFGTGIANALEFFGFGKPSAGAAQAPGARPPMPPSVEPSPAFPQAAGWMGEGDTPPAPQVASRQGNYGPAPSPAPVPMPTAPQGANAAFQPPPGWMPPADYMRTMGDADLGGYGGNPGMGKPIPAPPQYTNLNPTPSLEEIFRREYAANPGAFGKIG